jgi:hypothetical protein
VPTSDFMQIPDVLRVIMSSGAESILEIGIGFGKWGALSREYVEISRGRMPDEWKSRIEGIEIFERYRNPLWNAYDAVHIGDAATIIDTLGQFDLVMCCDVIEHFQKEDGQRLLEKMLDHGRVVLITSPRGESPQQAVYGNAHEEHKSVWSEADFARYPHRFANLYDTFIAAVARSEEPLAAIDVRPPDERIGARGMSRMLSGLIKRRLRSKLFPARRH